jgi:hypothetical protein
MRHLNIKFLPASVITLTNSVESYLSLVQRAGSGFQKAAYEPRTGFYSNENCFSNLPVTVLFFKSFWESRTRISRQPIKNLPLKYLPMRERGKFFNGFLVRICRIRKCFCRGS